MSKKKRKTRKEKEVSQYNFLKPSKIEEDKREVLEGEAVKANKKLLVNDYVFTDLKKVIQVIGFIVVLLAIFAIIIYKTEIFAQFFNKLNIKY